MANFGIAIETVLKNEGGYVFNPNDAGGETKFGISKRSYPNVDIKNLTVEGACAIYQKDFWLFGGIDSQAVATKLLDSYVLERHEAIKIAQRIAEVPDDGVYGSQTENAINRVDPNNFLIGMRMGLAIYHHACVAADPNDAEFLAGWLRRDAQ